MTQQYEDFVVVKISQLMPGDVVVGSMKPSHNDKLWALVITSNHNSIEHHDFHHYDMTESLLENNAFACYPISNITFLTREGFHNSDICSTKKIKILKR